MANAKKVSGCLVLVIGVLIIVIGWGFFSLLQVAMATESLCDAANAAVQGSMSADRMVAAAKSVANTTAQLLVACKVGYVVCSCFCHNDG